MPTYQLKSTWYKPPSLNTVYSKDKISELTHQYMGWWEAKFNKLWQHREEPIIPKSDVLRKTLLKERQIIGYVDERPVTINYVPPSHQFRYVPEIYASEGQEVESEGLTAPALYVVAWAGKRLDSFLTATNAKHYAKDFIKLNS